MGQRLESFDSLRAAAVIMVVFYHIMEIGNAPFGQIFRHGWIGVDLFFVLSGFFIGLSVLRTKIWSPKQFMIRRVRRIVPAYYFSILIIITFSNGYFLMTTNGWIHILSHLTFLHTYSTSFHGSINGAYWSLGVEFFFYILMALMAPIIRNDKYFPWVIAGWIAIAWTWRALVFYGVDQPPIFKFIWSTQLPGMLDEFAAGLVVAKLAVSGTTSRILKNNYFPGIAVVVSASAIFHFLNRLNTVNYWADDYSAIFSRTVLAIGFAFLLLIFLLIDKNRYVGLFTKYTGLQYIGKISYSIYLLHLPIMINATNNSGTSTIPSVLRGCIIFATIFFLSSLSYRFVENRFYK